MSNLIPFDQKINNSEIKLRDLAVLNTKAVTIQLSILSNGSRKAMSEKDVRLLSVITPLLGVIADILRPEYYNIPTKESFADRRQSDKDKEESVIEDDDETFKISRRSKNKKQKQQQQQPNQPKQKQQQQQQPQSPQHAQMFKGPGDVDQFEEQARLRVSEMFNEHKDTILAGLHNQLGRPATQSDVYDYYVSCVKSETIKLRQQFNEINNILSKEKKDPKAKWADEETELKRQEDERIRKEREQKAKEEADLKRREDERKRKEQEEERLRQEKAKLKQMSTPDLLNGMEKWVIPTQSGSSTTATTSQKELVLPVTPTVPPPPIDSQSSANPGPTLDPKATFAVPTFTDEKFFGKSGLPEAQTLKQSSRSASPTTASTSFISSLLPSTKPITDALQNTSPAMGVQWLGHIINP